VHDNDLLPEQRTSPEQNDAYSESLSLEKQQLMSPSACAAPSNSSSTGAQHAGQPDEALMDFWVLLQQTQANLQDMLVDLETAKVELDLSNQRANEAQQQVSSLRVQLSASEQRCGALEAQLHSSQNKYVLGCFMNSHLAVQPLLCC
jgi:hypothetical protein